MALTIEVLGSLTVRSGGRVVQIPKKGRALLGFLAISSGQRISRDRIADLIWPYQTSPQARHSLRNCLLEVRKANPGAVEANFSECWAGHELSSDLDRFVELSRSNELADLCGAMQLYRGALLDGFTIASEPWDEWLGLERDRYEAIAVDVLERLSSVAVAASDHHLAIRAAKRLVGFDQLSEQAHRCLMRTYLEAGLRAEAVRAYNNCVEILHRQLSVAPDHETLQLHQQMMASPPTAGLELPPTAKSVVVDKPQPRTAASDPRRAERKARLIKQLAVLADAAETLSTAAMRLRRAIEDVEETLEESSHPEPLTPSIIDRERTDLMVAASPR